MTIRFTLREWELIRDVMEDHRVSEEESNCPAGVTFALAILNKVKVKAKIKTLEPRP